MTISANFLERPILGGKVNFPVCLAPMVGLSHAALRAMVKSYLPADAVTPWPTEMLSSWRLAKESLGTTAETLRADDDPLVPQILGNEEQPIREAVQKLRDWGAAGVDINMGCPVQKALKHNYGVALMGDADYAAEVVAMTVRHAGVPVSVKLRAGLQEDREFLLRFTKGLENAGAAWITLHPRTASQQRRGSADWSQIRMVRENLKIPVIGNGDVQTSSDVFALLEQTNCDAVMVGRALAARPWMLWQVGEDLGFAPPQGREGEAAPRTASAEGAEYGRALRRLVDELEFFFVGRGDARGVSDFDPIRRRVNFFLRTTCVWLEFGHALMAQVSKAKSLVEIRAAVDRFFAVEQCMMNRTSLRE